MKKIKLDYKIIFIRAKDRDKKTIMKGFFTGFLVYI